MGRIADMPIARTGAVYADNLTEVSVRHLLPENRFGHGGSADIAEADEKY